MSDSAGWCVAALLVCAGLAADGCLAWTFIRDWARCGFRGRRGGAEGLTPVDCRTGSADRRQPPGL